MALKLDMSRAYDHMEQCFLEKLMRRMRFYSRWIDLIIECVRIVSYSILVNREPRGMINPSKGIRQGDPLSPFLFLLCTEGLHGLIMQATIAKEINGFSLCKRGPKLTPFFQMIASFFEGQTHKSVVMFLKFYPIMKFHPRRK